VLRSTPHAARIVTRRCWRQAIAILVPTGWQLFQAKIEEELAAFLIERGRPEEAVTLLDRLLPLYADPLAERPRAAVHVLLSRAHAAPVG
jgi:hypothetical protein